LRGKIMRIRVKDDGTYEIPDGNLFPKGTAKTRPEIYVMGDRNPYRITVDQKNSNLYWGEVGPDANNDSLATRGPRGYDEVNQARKAGYFGWPLFVGNNYAYRAYDYVTGQSGSLFDPNKPINDSRNNTGLRELPPAQPAFIWYPYGPSTDFPQVGTGGRNAMAGPVYYTDMFPKETRLPDYYNGKLIIYEWIRGWIKAVTLQPNGDFDKMEPFFPTLKVNSLIDMEVGPDGKLYLLEYGSGWFSRNPDAGLARIDFNSGNRPPEVKEITVDKTSGVLPLAVKINAKASDPENDKFTYMWDLGNGTTKETSVPELDYTYTTPGDYKISVEVKDSHGAASKSNSKMVYAGNETPLVAISLSGGNKSFYLPGVPVQYSVTVTDRTDTAKIDPANLYVSADYVEGTDRAGSALGHQKGQANIEGKNLILTLDCKSCHKEAEKSVGPGYLQVSQKYLKDKSALNYLSQKIIRGGAGVWGEVAMPAHPSLSNEDVRQMVTWILSLGDTVALKKSLPPSGTVTPLADQKPNSAFVLSASYTDKGGTNIKSLTGNNAVVLHSNTISFTGKEQLKGFAGSSVGGNRSLLFPAGEGWFMLENIDLTAVRFATLAAELKGDKATNAVVEIRLDAPNGKVLGKANFAVPTGQTKASTKVSMEAVSDGKMHSLYFIYQPMQRTDGSIRSVQFTAK
ncbi:MAG: PQQ-dependent sugar dehydrogenase, partial [Ferruginibacter sp.]